MRQIHLKELDRYQRQRQKRSRAQQVREVEERVLKNRNPKFRVNSRAEALIPYPFALVYDHTFCYNLVISGPQKETQVWL